MDLSHSLGQYIILAFAIAVAIFVTFYDFDKKDHQHNKKIISLIFIKIKKDFKSF
ncbi:hypothetical protein DSV84_09545 (plasmid) [Campylobacter coli]